jgi:hypothetical protein
LIVAMFFGVVQWKKIDGETVASPFGAITPEARSLVVRLPFGGFVCTKPVAVRIERDGSSARLPIPDPTRVAQLGLFGLIVVVFVLAALTAPRGRRSHGSK